MFGSFVFSHCYERIWLRPPHMGEELHGTHVATSHILDFHIKFIMISSHGSSWASKALLVGMGGAGAILNQSPVAPLTPWIHHGAGLVHLGQLPHSMDLPKYIRSSRGTPLGLKGAPKGPPGALRGPKKELGGPKRSSRSSKGPQKGLVARFGIFWDIARNLGSKFAPKSMKIHENPQSAKTCFYAQCPGNSGT